MDSDMLVVMDSGNVAECGSPAAMLDPDSDSGYNWLAGMVNALGENEAAHLVALANNQASPSLMGGTPR